MLGTIKPESILSLSLNRHRELQVAATARVCRTQNDQSALFLSLKFRYHDPFVVDIYN